MVCAGWNSNRQRPVKTGSQVKMVCKCQMRYGNNPIDLLPLPGSITTVDLVNIISSVEMGAGLLRSMVSHGSCVPSARHNKVPPVALVVGAVLTSCSPGQLAGCMPGGHHKKALVPEFQVGDREKLSEVISSVKSENQIRLTKCWHGYPRIRVEHNNDNCRTADRGLK